MSGYQTRRATVDDQPALVELWNSAHLPAAVLEAALTDFQLVLDPSGRLVAAIGLQIENSSGRMHAEAFADFGLTDELRPLLWQRVLQVARGYGLFRLWTEEQAPWWKRHAGFEPADDSVKSILPAEFGRPDGSWLMLRLREETPDDAALEQKIAELRGQQRKRVAGLAHRSKVIRYGLTALLGLFWILGLIALFRLARGR